MRKENFVFRSTHLHGAFGPENVEVVRHPDTAVHVQLSHSVVREVKRNALGPVNTFKQRFAAVQLVLFFPNFSNDSLLLPQTPPK